MEKSISAFNRAHKPCTIDLASAVSFVESLHSGRYPRTLIGFGLEVGTLPNFCA